MKRFVKDVGDGELTVDECTTCAESGRLFLKGVDDTFFEPRLLFASGNTRDQRSVVLRLCVAMSPCRPVRCRALHRQ